MVEAIIRKYKWERLREAIPLHKTVKPDFMSAPAFLYTYTKDTIEQETSSNNVYEQI